MIWSLFLESMIRCNTLIKNVSFRQRKWCQSNRRLVQTSSGKFLWFDPLWRSNGGGVLFEYDLRQILLARIGFLTGSNGIIPRGVLFLGRNVSIWMTVSVDFTSMGALFE